jgi:hypothetical protein
MCLRLQISSFSVPESSLLGLERSPANTDIYVAYCTVYYRHMLLPCAPHLTYETLKCKAAILLSHVFAARISHRSHVPSSYALSRLTHLLMLQHIVMCTTNIFAYDSHITTDFRYFVICAPLACIAIVDGR